MKIHYKGSGGIINLQLEYHADTDELDQDLAEDLLDLVESANAFEIQPSDIAPTSDGPPDVFYYELQLSDPGRQISLTCNDVTAPVELRPLLARLQELAMEQRLKGT